jgi:hypothetical protein
VLQKNNLGYVEAVRRLDNVVRGMW